MVWTDRPMRPLSPHQERRRAELGAILTVFELVVENWAAYRNPAGEREHLNMLLAATRWFCRLRVPDSDYDAVLGPPLLTRLRGRPSGAGGSDALAA